MVSHERFNDNSNLDNCPRKIVSHEISPGMFPSGKLPVNNSPPGELFLGQLLPLKFPQGPLPLEQFPLNNFPSGRLLKIVLSWVFLSLNFTLAKRVLQLEISRGHCKLFIRAVSIFYIFSLILLLNHGIKTNFFSA